MKPALTPTTTYEGPDGFTRTALVAAPGCASVDVVDASGRRLCQINIVAPGKDGTLIVDVIDVDGLFTVRNALTFPAGVRQIIPAGSVVSADFRNAKL